MATSPTNDLNASATLRGVPTEQKLFGRYTLGKILGRGGMGVVYLAHDDELLRKVAMKFLPDMIVRDREAVEDLKRETRRSLDLTHHHIVRIYDFTQDSECAAIIMEYVDGESLSAMKTQQAGGCFSVSTIQSWVSHFCQAMDYAHRQARVVHRDLKPANLMINGRGDLKVTDFGISRSMSDSMTRVSMSNSAGTLAYMSPEQALGSPPAVGDDIYAFGATVYDMLTGRPPFFRGNLQVQLETVVPPPMESRRAELGNSGEPIPALWEEVIAACLSKRPQDRPQGMAEIASLLGVGGSTTIGFRPGTGRTTTGTGGPGTSATAAATNRTATTADAPTAKTSTAPGAATARPATHQTLQPTRAEDVLFDYAPRVSTKAPAPSPTSRTEPVAPPVEPPPVAPEPEPEPTPAPAAFEAPPAPVEPGPSEVVPEPEPVVMEAPPAEPPPVIPEPEPEPEPVAVEAPRAELPPPISQIPITTRPPADKEFAATLEMPAVKPPATERVVPPPSPTPPPAPAPALRAALPPPAPAPTSVSSPVKIGHAIGSGASRKSGNTGLILAGVGVIALVALLGLWAGHGKSSGGPRKAEVASHLEAANTALTAGDLAGAGREIAAVKSLDPANAKLGALQSSLQQKQTEQTQRLAAEKAAKDKQIAEQQAREQAEKDRLAKIEQEKERLAKLEQDRQEKARAAAAEMARQQQAQFDAALAKAGEAIGRRDPAAARQSLAAALQLRPTDAEIPKLTARIAALEDDLKRTADTTPDVPDKPAVTDEPADKPGRKPAVKEKEAAKTKTKPKRERESEPEPSRPVVSRPPPVRPQAPSVPPRRSDPFHGGAPGG